MTTPIRILHLITGLNTGGAELALYRLLKNMDRAKFDMQVVSIIPIGSVGEKIRDLGFSVTSLEMSPGKPNLVGFLRLIRFLKNFKPTILQTWLYHADLLGLLAAKIASTPNVIWNIRSADMDFSQYNRLSGLVMRTCSLLSNIPNVIIINSKAGQSVHTNLGYRPKEWRLIHNGIDSVVNFPNKNAGFSIRNEWNINKNDLLVGHVGRIDPQKGHGTFLEAAAIVKASRPNVRFVCIGEGPENYWEKMKKISMDLGLSELIWAGTRNDMPAVYNALDILVSSSIGEGFPNVVAEAMACGISCVVTDVGDSSLLIGDTGKSSPPGNPQALASEILAMLELSAVQRNLLGLRARQRIDDNFSLGKDGKWVHKSLRTNIPIEPVVIDGFL